MKKNNYISLAAILIAVGIFYFLGNKADSPLSLDLGKIIGNSGAPGSQLAALEGAGSGLVGYWKFDEGSGTTAVDSSGSGNSGNVLNGASWTTGQSGGALSFDGVNDYVQLISQPTNFAQPFTITAWVKSNTNSGNHQIFTGSGGDVQFYQGSTLLSYRTHSVTTSFDTAFNTTNSWQNIAAAYDGASITLYVNGVSVATKAVSAVNDTSLTIGSYMGVAEFFSGAIDEVRVYNRSLSSTEIGQIYAGQIDSGNPPVTPPPPPPSDTTPPVISSVSSSGLSVSGATIGWSTDESSDSQVEYGLTSSYGQSSSLNSSMTASHAVSISGLSSNTLYHYRVRSADASGNTAFSGDNIFTTSAVVTTPPPPVVTGTYYVDNAAGSDSNSGGSASPFKTIQKAAGLVNPGETVIVRNGTYSSSNWYILNINRGGNSSNWVTFRSENKWGAKIDGLGNTATQYGVLLAAPYVRFQDFEITGTSKHAMDASSGNLEIIGNHVHDIGRRCIGDSIGITGFHSGGTASVLIEGNRFHDIGRYSPGENGCSYTSGYAGYMNLDHGIYVDAVSNYTIRNNIFYNHFHGWGIQVYGNGAAGSTGLSITNNTFAFANPNRDGHIVLSTPSVANTTIANNIFYSPRVGGVRLDSTSSYSGISIVNNITYGGAVTSGTGSGVSIGTNFNNTDPKIVSAAGFDFHLQSTSPAIDAVLSAFGVSTDFDGNARSNGLRPDIGAYEYMGVIPPPVATPIVPAPTPVPVPPPADTTLPTVSITTPLNGSTLSGSNVSISAAASDNVAVTSVTFKLDGVTMNPIFTTAPYSGTWNTAAVANGTHVLTATAVDSSGNSKTSASFSVTVSNVVPNSAPVLALIGTKAVAEGSLLTFTTSATDANGDALSYSAASLPTGATFNASTRVFAFTPTYTQAGSFSPVFSVSDGKGGTDLETVLVTVTNTNRAPVADAGVNQTIVLTTTALSASGSSDPDGSALTYSWSKVSGPGTVTFSAASSVNTNATFSISGTYVIQLSVSDGLLSSTDQVTVALNQVLPSDSDSDGIVDASDKCPGTPTSLSSVVNAVGCPKPKATKFTVAPNVTSADLTAVTSVDISNSFAKISYLASAAPYVLVKDNGTYKGQLDIDANLTLSSGVISLNAVGLPEFNKPATITLYNIALTNPVIKKDGVDCDQCSFVSYDGSTFIFRVNGFSTYTVVSGSVNPTPVPVGGGTAGGAGGGSAGGGGSTGGGSTDQGNIAGGAGSEPLVGLITPTVPQAQVQVQPVATTCAIPASFTRKFVIGSTGEDVRQLQKFLNAYPSTGSGQEDLPFRVAKTGPGSPGNETTYYGTATHGAVMRFEKSCSTGTTVGAASNPSAQVDSSALPNTGITQRFARSLKVGATGEDVRRLQKFLNAQGLAVALSGAGSKGLESTYFGPATFKAVVKFQDKYASDILTPNGLSKGTGYFGPSTLKKANLLLGL